ncbi:MAG: hypothetical protein IGS23_20890 [Rivularia sp. T60_A2020_040]|nr:hypothetical protein [Rivularia sp. T60_A2020_040]
MSERLSVKPPAYHTPHNYPTKAIAISNLHKQTRSQSALLRHCVRRSRSVSQRRRSRRVEERRSNRNIFNTNKLMIASLNFIMLAMTK